MTNKVLIYSNHHRAWWGPNGNRYFRSVERAGHYDPADTAQWLGRGCGCCPAPEVVVPVPNAYVQAIPEALAAHVAAATRAAIDAGKVNRYAKKCEHCKDAYSRGECCSSHGKSLCHGCYRRTHFVEVCVSGCGDCAAENLNPMARVA